MTQYDFLNEIDSIEKAIKYMKTVQCSTECYNAIVNILNNEKETLINDSVCEISFKKLSCMSTE